MASRRGPARRTSAWPRVHRPLSMSLASTSRPTSICSGWARFDLPHKRKAGIGENSTHLCGALPQRLPLDAAQDAAHKLLVELCVDHLEALDVAERQGEVGRVGAGARGAREEVLRDEADHLGGLKEGRRSTARVLRGVVSGLGAERDERGWSSRLEFERRSTGVEQEQLPLTSELEEENAPQPPSTPLAERMLLYAISCHSTAGRCCAVSEPARRMLPHSRPLLFQLPPSLLLWSLVPWGGT